MKDRFLFFILLFLTLISKAQTQNAFNKSATDSLWNIWMDESNLDTVRMSALYDMADLVYKSVPDSALKILDLEYEFATQIKNDNYRANALQFKGFVYTRKGEHEKALAHNLASWEIHKLVGRQDYIAKIVLNVGNSYQYLGDYTKAAEFYQLGLEIALEHNIKLIAGKCYSSLGVIHFNYGEFAIAHEYYKKAIAIFLELNDQTSISTTYNNMSILALRQGNFELALEYSFKSLEIKMTLNDQKAIANSYATLGTIYAEKKEDQTSLDYYNKCLSMRKELKDKPGIAAMYNNMATLYDKLSQDTLAIEMVHMGLELFRELGDKRMISSSLINIGGFYLEAYQISLAKKYIEEGYMIAQEARFLKMINNASRKLFLCYYREKNYATANTYISNLRNTRIEEIGMNFFTLSEKEKDLYFNTMLSDFELYFDFTLAKVDSFPYLADTAFNTALQIKGLTLKSSTAMRSAVLNSGDSTLIADYEKWILLKKKISGAYSRGDNFNELEKEANEIEKNLALKSKAFNDFDKIKNLDWKAVQASLKPDECAIEFIHFLSETDTANPVIYAALLILPQSMHPQIIRLCTEEDLIQILGKLQGNNLLFVNQIYGTRKEAKSDLYDKIWRPIENHLDGIKTIYYSPSGLLHKISFASIAIPVSKKPENIFLSDLYQFRHMGSTGNKVTENKTGFGQLENFLIMGGVEYNSDTTLKSVWDYLPGSLSETEKINGFLNSKKFGVNYFKQNNASEEIFKEKIGSSSFVHIATHGFFFPDPEQVKQEFEGNSVDESQNQEIEFRGTTNYANWNFVSNKNPLMRSGIVLANANDVWQRDPLTQGEDGILTALEVSNLDLSNTKLVVLSACETGLGDIKGSEGVYGLQRAFKMAGVKYLIMSLWQVPDKETSEFMILFYKNLIKLKDIPTAFQKTQKVMREKYDPYYWAAFTLIE